MTSVMKPMPKSARELTTEATSLGLFGKNRVKITESHPRGKLLNHAYSSYKANRRFDHTSIILLGKTGVGKSSVINHLLNVGVRTSAEESETRSTTEYIIEAPVKEFAVTDLSLRIIDTPGFEDTSGLEQAACNLHSISTFCHELLGSNMVHNVYPNIVMLCIQANDTRFKGPKSPFRKTLHAIRSLNIVDQQNPNVIIVITFACSLPHKRGEYDEEWEKLIIEKGDKVRQVVCDTLGVYAPVTWLENWFTKHNLEKQSGYTVLPNKELQPQNLYLKIIRMLKDNKDHLGHITLREMFGRSDKTQESKTGHSVQAKIAEKEQLDPKETQIYNALKKFSGSGVGLPEVTWKINQFISQREKYLTADDKKEARSISIDLVERIGLTTKEEVKQYKIGGLNLLLSKPLSPFGAGMMKHLFEIHSEGDMPQTVLGVGKGYNIITDKWNPSAIFEATDKGEHSLYGILIPPGMTINKVSVTESYMENHKDKESYVNRRLAQLNVSADVDYTLLRMTTRGGLSIQSSRQGTMNVEERSFLLEKRLFQVEIDNLQHPDMKVTEAFTKAVTDKLPDAYDGSSDKNRLDYADFFGRWGHFIVSSAFGGGSIEAKVNIEAAENSKEAEDEAKMELDATLEGLTKGYGAGLDMNLASSGQASRTSCLTTKRLRWVGGNDNYHSTFLKDITPNDWKLWQASLASNPAILTTEMSLLPIYDVVELVDPKKVEGCRDAWTALLGVKFGAPKREKQIEAEEPQFKEEQEEAGRKKDAKSTPDPKSGGHCYASNSKVYLQDMTVKMAADVSVGDSLLVSAECGTLKFSEVVIINHKSPDAPTEFCQIFYDLEKEPLKITPKHIVMVNGSAQYAGDVKIGDTLLVLHKTHTCLEQRLVQRVEKITLRGFHAPITMDGKLVVDDVLTSCYAHVPEKFVLGRKVTGHKLAHIGMAPFRMMRKMNIATKMLKINEGEDMPQAIQWAVKRVLPHILK